MTNPYKLIAIIAVLFICASCFGIDGSSCPQGQALFTCRVHILPGPACGVACPGWEQDLTRCAFNGADLSNQIVVEAQQMIAAGYYKNIGVHACWAGTSSNVPPFPGPLAECDPLYESCDQPPEQCCGF